MKSKFKLLGFSLVFCFFISFLTSNNILIGQTMDTGKTTEIIIAMERAALDRWGKGDPSGFLEISAPDVCYFDPFLEKRLDGIEALTNLYESFRGQAKIDSYELIDPRVQIIGDAAVLTFNYISNSGKIVYKWNCTEVYANRGGKWQIVQTHWSMTRPENR